jgi:hypothetical protein
MKRILAWLAGIFNRTNRISPNAGYGNHLSQNTGDIKPLIISGEDTWNGDIILSIVSYMETPDARIYKALSSWHGRNLGLMVSIPQQTGEKGFGTGFEVKSIGEESDHLLQTMGDVWGQKLNTSSRLRPELSLAYVDLKEFGKSLGAPHDPNSPYSRYKLFFQGSSDEDYAELYINVNAIEKILEIMEKDSGYREPLTRWLTA